MKGRTHILKLEESVWCGFNIAEMVMASDIMASDVYWIVHLLIAEELRTN
jgi:hypothetical protein